MRKKPITILVCLIVLLSGCTTPNSEETKSIFHGEEIQTTKPVIDFQLTTNDNTTYNFTENTEGKVVVIAFLFTNCFDICPIVTYNLRMIHETLNQSQLEYIEFITITVDPWRDNITTLTEWKDRTKSNWTHLTVSNIDDDSEEMKILNNVWANFGVGFTVEENATTSGRHHPADYNINHSTGTVLVDHLGHQRVWWGDYNWIVDLVEEDIFTLVEKAEKQ